MEKIINVGFIGNPNCGKTTLFNAYTGANLKVANWPGVTVEKKEGFTTYEDQKFRLIDLPGIYSLTSYTMEETVSRECIMSDEVDVIVDVIDASSLERNLYLALQLIELGKPVVLALNMMDIVESRGMEIDLHRLPEMLGIPAIPVSARKKTGLSILLHAVSHHSEYASQGPFIHHHKGMHSEHRHNHHSEYAMVYSDLIEDKIDALITLITATYPEMDNMRWHAIKYLEMDKNILDQYPLAGMEQIVDRSYEKDIINQKYDFIEEIIQEVLVNKDKEARSTDRIDAVLTDNVWGIPIFLAIMAFIFFLTFTIGDIFKNYLVEGIDIVSNDLMAILNSIDVSPIISSLLIDGAIAGIGGILAFLPNIFILFLALAVLEDSGYMSRVAYVMDSVMGKIGLSGRAFIPLLLGFGCSVPAIMASRALEDPKDRLRTILVTPFMSCSARLPIYILFSGMFFPEYAMFVAFSMYVIGIVMAIIIAKIFYKVSDKSDKKVLLIELPEYKSPNVMSIFLYAWEKVKSYLAKAGTTIFVASIIIWFILNFNFSGMVDIGDSFGAQIGRLIAPILVPAGLGLWQIAVALISGIAAKEVVVASLSVLYGILNINSAEGMNTLVGQLAQVGFHELNAYVLMVFCLLYTPCIASIVTIKKETNSTKWTCFAIFFQLLIAYLVAVIIYQVGSNILY